MPRIGSGAITITEVTDGATGIPALFQVTRAKRESVMSMPVDNSYGIYSNNFTTFDSAWSANTTGFAVDLGTAGEDEERFLNSVTAGTRITFTSAAGNVSTAIILSVAVNFNNSAVFNIEVEDFDGTALPTIGNVTIQFGATVDGAAGADGLDAVGFTTVYHDLNSTTTPSTFLSDWKMTEETDANNTFATNATGTVNWSTSIQTIYLDAQAGSNGSAQWSDSAGQFDHNAYFSSLRVGDTCVGTHAAITGTVKFTVREAPVKVGITSTTLTAIASNGADTNMYRIRITVNSVTGLQGLSQTQSSANAMNFNWSRSLSGTNGARGPVIGFYAPYLTANSCTVADNNPVGIDLTSATIQTNLDRSASCANFGDTTTVPVDNDFGVFFNNGDPSQKLVVVHNGTDWVTGTRVIDGSLLVTGSITASEIATNAVTANKVDVDGDVHINAPSGSATSSGLSIGPLNTYPDIVNTARPETSGAFLGLDTRDTNVNTQGKFFVGNKSQFIDWNGAQLRIGGNILTSGNIVSIDGSQVTRSTYILDGRNSGPDDSARVNAFIPQSSINDAANGLTYDELNTGSFGITSGGSLAAGQWGITTNVLSSTGLDDFDSGVGVLWLDNIDANGVDRSAEIAALDSDSTITFSTTESGKTGTVSMSVNSVTNIDTRYFISISNVTGSIQDLSTTNGVLVSFGLNSLVIDVDTGSSTIFETVVPTGSRGRTLTPIVQNGNTLVGSANRTVEFAFIGVNQQMYGRGYSSSQMYNPANGSTFTFGYNDREESNSPANGNGLAPGQWEIRLNNGTTTPESTFDPSGSSRDNELVLIFSRFDRDGVDRTGELSTINDNDVITFSNSAGTLVIELTVTSTPSGNTSIPTTPADTLDTSGQLLSGSFIFFIDNINVTTGSQGDAVSANDNVNVTFATTQDDDDVYRQTTLLESDWTVINPTVVIDDGPEVISFRVTPLGDAEINNLHFTAAAGNIEETVRVTTVGGALDGTSSRGFGITQPFDKIENVTITPISTANIITSGALDVNNVAGTELTADFNDWRIFSYGLYLVNPPAPFVNGGQTFGIPDPTVPPDNRMGLKGGILMVKVEGY